MHDPQIQRSIEASVRGALAEDIGSGDVTAMLVAPDARATARVIVREQAILCGGAWFDEVFKQLDPSIDVAWDARDGERLVPEQRVCVVTGGARSILSGERTALNFLQTLSGTASAAARYVELVAHTACRILDTRKTLPGLRLAQKYAVRCGGATNHRVGLYDAVLIKENHIASAGGVNRAVELARQANPGLAIEIEVESLADLEQALDADAERLLLDNFSVADLEHAVALNAKRGEKRALLEASGGLTDETLAQVAMTGVDFISVGALTKHLRATDYSMRFEFTADT